MTSTESQLSRNLHSCHFAERVDPGIEAWVDVFAKKIKTGKISK